MNKKIALSFVFLVLLASVAWALLPVPPSPSEREASQQTTTQPAQNQQAQTTTKTSQTQQTTQSQTQPQTTTQTQPTTSAPTGSPSQSPVQEEVEQFAPPGGISPLVFFILVQLEFLAIIGTLLFIQRKKRVKLPVIKPDPLRDYIKNMLIQGYPIQQIRTTLAQSGRTPFEIEKAIKNL